MMKAASPDEVVFRDQFGLGRQPTLHFAPGQQRLIYKTKSNPFGHVVR